MIAVPYPLGFNHIAIAEFFKSERDIIRTILNYSPEIPHLWVAHSLGCKYIALLEIQKDIIDSNNQLIHPIPREVENSTLEIVNSLREVAKTLIKQR